MSNFTPPHRFCNKGLRLEYGDNLNMGVVSLIYTEVVRAQRRGP